jgi:aldehyde:ferredoxin oxidoreductase
MGSKRLKAISVRGSGRVSLADPERIREITRAVGAEAWIPRQQREGILEMNEQLAGQGEIRPSPCTEYCLSPCTGRYEGVPGCAYDRQWSGTWACVGALLAGVSEDGPVSHGGVYDWRLGARGGLEANALCNGYGINQWDLIIGIVPWLEACQAQGLVNEVNGRRVDWRSPSFWAVLLHAIAYREGMGDALAEGGWRAARSLCLGEELMRRYYTGWGQAGHWDGHGDWANHVVYPYWLVAALQWATDTRDPISSGHGYVVSMMGCSPLGGQLDISWEQMRAISARIYGDPAAVDPCSGYAEKAAPAAFHTRRSVIKDCLPVDDFAFPMMYSPNTPDRFCRVAGIDGPSIEYHLFRAGTGTDWTEDEFEMAAARVYTLERAVAVRHWARDRRTDETVLPSFEYPENWVNPLLGERHALDREQFTPVMDDYYRLQGWDERTGWPTKERLSELGMAEVYQPMVEGAEQSRRRPAGMLPDRG